MNNHETSSGVKTEDANENPWAELTELAGHYLPPRQLEGFGSDSEMVDVPSIRTKEIDGLGSESSKVRVPDDVKQDNTPKKTFDEFGEGGKEKKFDGAPKKDESTKRMFSEFGTNGRERTFSEDIKKVENVPDDNQELKPFGSE